MRLLKLLSAVICLGLFSGINAQNTASLDSTFGLNGKTTTIINPEGYLISSPIVRVQDDGKIIIASQFSEYPVLVRYLPDGQLDPTWGQNGIASTVDYALHSSLVLSMVIQDNGKVVLAGYKNNMNGVFENYIIKYNTDGSLDQSFGNNGITYYSHTPATEFLIRSMFIFNSKIYLAGVSPMQMKFGFIAFDLNTGILDTTFGNNNILITDFNSGPMFLGTAINCNVVDGKIRAFTGTRIHQLLPNFQVDVNGDFGNNGFIELPCNMSVGGGGGAPHGNIGYSIVMAPKIENDRQFLLTGMNHTCGSGDLGLVAKYHANGALDSSFAINGTFNYDFRSDSTEKNYINSVNSFSNNYILVAGGVYKNTSDPADGRVIQKFAMALFDDNGNPISSFGNNGVYKEDYFHTSDSLDWLNHSFIQDDDKIVLVGVTPFYDMHYHSPTFPQYPHKGNISVNLSRYVVEGISQTGNVGITKQSDEHFGIYPNPTNSILNFKSNELIKNISIYNYLGKLVHQKSDKSISQINVEKLSSGLYSIQLEGINGGIYVDKFIKE